MDFDPEILQEVSWVAVVLTFLGGVITSLGPCNIATIPLIMGYVGGSTTRSRWRSFNLSLSFALGLAITFMLLGIFASLIGGLIGSSVRGWYYLVAGICFVIGLQMLGVFKFPIPLWLGSLREKVGMKGIPGAIGLGLISGLVASQCATPVMAAILTYVMAKGALIYGAVLLFVYALGRGVPVVLAGTFTGMLKQMQAFGRWTKIMEMASGLIIIAVGLYFLWIA